ncbi:hypothetical protein J2X65_000896 [Ancylobacter sp. 3268]|uniref:hypothetical protein n=1 Tax=Ancylobacter sp. 3268 TaxID=2817752 RepID=UPI002866B42A|nr:hypothetical protein [Ancylobacter sp. 3268]MDR6951547.1 hypothetical protein [Ancylobacter sp. 3268]
MPSPDTDDKLDPQQERVLRKLRGFAAFSGILMGFGFLALFGAIGYRVMVGWKSVPKEISGTIMLPQGAQVVSSTVSDGLLAVTVNRQGVVETRLFDIETRAPRGIISYAHEP